MELIGYRRSDFQAQDGTKVTGYNVFIATDIDPRRGAGVSVERYYLSDAKIKRHGLDLASLLGKNVKAYYNRFGKLDSLSTDEA